MLLFQNILLFKFSLRPSVYIGYTYSICIRFSVTTSPILPYSFIFHVNVFFQAQFVLRNANRNLEPLEQLAKLQLCE